MLPKIEILKASLSLITVIYKCSRKPLLVATGKCVPRMYEPDPGTQTTFFIDT